jgi:hypothetical protein
MQAWPLHQLSPNPSTPNGNFRSAKGGNLVPVSRSVNVPDGIIRVFFHKVNRFAINPLLIEVYKDSSDWKSRPKSKTGAFEPSVVAARWGGAAFHNIQVSNGE